MEEKNAFILHKKDSDPSSVWHYFLTSNDGKSAQCKQCNCKSILKTLGGSTKGLHTHLFSRHNKKVLTLTQASNKAITSASASTSAQQSEAEVKVKPEGKIKRKIDDYFSAGKELLDVILARMTALDGLPFSIFVTSKDLRSLLIAKGYKDLPSSHVTIRNKVVRFSKVIKNEVTTLMNECKMSGERFSLSFDEWTSTSNKRYMNINVHASKQSWCLGMLKIKGSLTAKACVEHVKVFLERYNLSLEKDIVAIVTDGPSVMVKVGKLLNTEHQLCFAHGIHLAVCDVLYGKKSEKKDSNERVVEQILESDESDGDEEQHFKADAEVINSSENVAFFVDNNNSSTGIAELTSDLNISKTITNVRKIVKFFKRSPTKNELVLQKYVITEKGKELSLLLDVKTRWNSLLTMIERFVELKTCIKKALIDFNHPLTLEEHDFVLLEHMVQVLTPVKLTVEALCRRDSNLVTADAALKFMFKQLETNCSSSMFLDKIKTALLERVLQRRKVELSGVLNYLQNPIISQDEPDMIKACFPVPSQKVIRNQIKHYLERLDDQPKTNVNEEETELSEDETSIPPVNKKLKIYPPALKTILQEEIENSMKTPEPAIHNQDLDAILKKEMSLYENGGIRGRYLESVYKYLLTVPPTSVESERAFSAAGYICNKLRSRLDEETIDALIFLRSYFQKLKV